MAAIRVFTDANVLYASVVRDLLMELGKAGVLTLLWSEEVHEEWTASLLRNRPDLHRSRVMRTRDLIVRALPGAMVTNYERRARKLVLPDPRDRHVLAAAITGEASVLLTFNIAHFPREIADRCGIAVATPDNLFSTLLGVQPEAVIEAATTARGRMRQPELSPTQYVDALKRAQLPATAAELGKYANQL